MNRSDDFADPTSTSAGTCNTVSLTHHKCCLKPFKRRIAVVTRVTRAHPADGMRGMAMGWQEALGPERARTRAPLLKHPGHPSSISSQRLQIKCHLSQSVRACTGWQTRDCNHALQQI